jgi:hypothetical protein
MHWQFCRPAFKVLQNNYWPNLKGQPVHWLWGNNKKSSCCVPPICRCSTEVITTFHLTRILTFKRDCRDGNRFRNILQTTMGPHYDRLGAERGKGMFLRMKVSPNLPSYFCSIPI